MAVRTDLCIESASLLKHPVRGVKQSEETRGEMRLIRMEVRTKEAAARLKKAKGVYITARLPHFAHNPVNSKETMEMLSETLRSLLPKAGHILVLGVGNRKITPDALGPLAADGVLATSHLEEKFGFRKVSVLCPGVLGQTGIELATLLLEMVNALEPAAVIAIDALAAMEPANLGCTIQITDTGIAPGSGVSNHRKPLNFETLGVPVIGIGVPTVIDAASLLQTFSGVQSSVLFSSTPTDNLMVTPRDVDLMVKRAATFLSESLNVALQEAFAPEELHYLLA